MKKLVCLLMTGIFIAAFAWAGGGQEAGGDWVPNRNIDFIVTNSTGGGADIAARTLADIITRENLLPTSIVVRNWTDGAGEVARGSIAAMRAGVNTDHTLLKFSADDMVNMVSFTPRRVTDFAHLALFAAEKHLFYAPQGSDLITFQAVIDRINAGQSVVVGGSRGTDPLLVDILRQRMGWSEAQMPYVTSQSTGDAITQLLGGHLDLIISKPAAADPFVESGHLIPFLALAYERLAGNLANAPTIGELGFQALELPNWRTIAAAPTMRPEAQTFWVSVIERATQTRQWTVDFVERFQVIPHFLTMQSAVDYIVGIQNDVLSIIGN